MEGKDRLLGLLLRGGLFALFLWTIQGELVPLALGAMVAMLLSPLAGRLSRRSPRGARLAPLLLTIGVLLLGVIPLGLFAGQVVVSVNAFLASGPGEAFDRIVGFASTRLSWLADLLRLDIDRVRASAVGVVQDLGTWVAGFAGGLASAFPGQILDAFLFVLAIYYLLRDGPRLVGLLRRLSPLPGPETDALFSAVRDTVHGAVLGQLVTSGVQGGLTLVALLVFGIPGALLFGILAAVLSIVPLVGTTPVTLGAVLYLVASGRYGAAIGMGIAAVAIGLSDNVVRPLVQSSRGGLHPLVALISIIGGVEAMGAGGVFLGPAIAALAVRIVGTYAAGHRPDADEPPRDP